MDSPFLTQFKKERIDDFLSSSIKLKYDTQLDYNILETKNNDLLMTMTKTQVKTEQPDEATDELSAEQLRKLYLQTKSITEVKSEQPDEIEEIFYQELMATQTFTKTINESSDEDY